MQLDASPILFERNLPMATSKKRLYLSGADRIFLISKLSGDYGEQALRLSKYFKKSLWEEGLALPSEGNQTLEPEAPEPEFDEAAFMQGLGLSVHAPSGEAARTEYIDHQESEGEGEGESEPLKPSDF